MPKIFILIGATIAAGWLFFFSLKNQPNVSQKQESTDSQVFLGQIKSQITRTPVETFLPSPFPVATYISTQTPTIRPTASPFVSSTPEPSPKSTKTPAPTPTPTAVPTQTPTPTVTSESTPSPDPSASPTATPASEPLLPVIINEVAWMGTLANTADEWIEIYNPNSSPVNISGWVLKSATDNKPNITFPDGASISAYGYFLIERSDNNTIIDILADLFIAFGSGSGAGLSGVGLSNSGEILELFDSEGNLQDRVVSEGSWPGGDNTSKSSMERSTGSNWGTNNGSTRNGLDAAGNPINGTPKAKNSITP